MKGLDPENRPAPLSPGEEEAVVRAVLTALGQPGKEVALTIRGHGLEVKTILPTDGSDSEPIARPYVAPVDYDYV